MSKPLRTGSIAARCFFDFAVDLRGLSIYKIFNDTKTFSLVAART
jgi:hypothetical protein